MNQMKTNFPLLIFLKQSRLADTGCTQDNIIAFVSVGAGVEMMV